MESFHVFQLADANHSIHANVRMSTVMPDPDLARLMDVAFFGEIGLTHIMNVHLADLQELVVRAFQFPQKQVRRVRIHDDNFTQQVFQCGRDPFALVCAHGIRLAGR